MKKYVLWVVVAALVSAAGCKPRGETKTLDEVYTIAQEDFLSSIKNAASPLQERLKAVEQKVADMASSQDARTIKNLAGQLADEVIALTSSAGYTSRPSLGELAAQLRELAGTEEPILVSKSQDPRAVEPAGRVRLLAARTFTLLAAELKGVKFGLSEREMKQGGNQPS